MSESGKVIVKMANRFKWKRGAELGVFRGETFKFVANSIKDIELIGVDLYEQRIFNENNPWSEGKEEYVPGENGIEWDHQKYYTDLNIFCESTDYRCKIIKDYTTNAAKNIEDNSLDFVFIDADHSYEAVKKDITEWYQKIKNVGYILGNDIDWPTVKKAVEEKFDKDYELEENKIWFHKKNGELNMNKSAKIVMVAMFKNEAKVLRKMLDSVTPYIDFWVIQNNGSTDGSDQITREWAAETGIPGILYDVEEGWVGFGWNRDHLIRYCQSVDHGCDWILKMDCDETLEVDDDFDWSPLDDKNSHGFNIPAVNGTGVYYRTWMWNSNLPWAFNHDPCHETIYCQLPEIDHSYHAVNLPVKFRQMGSNDGESWANPVKFISDALILEEKMIKEGTMLQNMYHFWYVGKSYRDAFESSGFPLGKTQADEYARRCIYYFHEYINAVYKQRNGNVGIDEVCYLSLILSGEAYIFLNKKEEAILAYKQSEQFAPRRNDHLIVLARLYKETHQYEKMLEVAEKMMQPERTNPFPEYCNFIDSAHYYDSPTGNVQAIYAEAQKLAGKTNIQEITTEKMPIPEITIEVAEEKSGETKLFMINTQPTKRFFIVDNFYSNPDAIRDYALTQVNYKEDLRWYKGMRSDTNFAPIEIKEAFEKVIDEEIHNWEDYTTNGVNGCFQIMLSKDQQVYHYDEQKWAAMIYLSPNAPFESGTRLHASKINGAHHSWEQPDIIDDAFKGDFYDSTKWDTIDSAGNVYNRLVIMDARHVHSAGSYFGNTKENGRLTHLFFFD